MSIDALKKRIKEKRIGGPYIFFGDEEYLKDHYLGRLRAVIDESPLPEFNRFVFDEKKASFSDLRDAVETLPSMAEFKLIELHSPDFSKMKSDRAEFYDSLLSDLPDYISLVFFFRADEADEKTFSASTRLPSGRISALVRRNGLIVEFKKESEQKLYSWIKRHFSHDGAQITDAGIEQLVAMCGSEMYVLAGETEKLICSYNGTPITEDDVKRVCCANSAYRIFDMSAAVASGDYTRAGGILEYLIFEKTPPELILATLGRCFSDMLFVGDALGRGEDFRSVAASLKMQEWQVRRTASNASRAGSGFARYAISECVRTDRRLKSVSCSAYPAIRLLLAKLSMYGKR